LKSFANRWKKLILQRGAHQVGPRLELAMALDTHIFRVSNRTRIAPEGA
jgi:hypothetical protein